MPTIDQQSLTIKDAASFLGVSTKTLRRWESTGRLLSKRTSGGHRRYLKSELNLFRGIRSQLKTSPEKSKIKIPANHPMKIRKEPILLNYDLPIESVTGFGFYRVIKISIAISGVAVLFLATVALIPYFENSNLGKKIASDLTSSSRSENPPTPPTSTVLHSQTTAENLTLTINSNLKARRITIDNSKTEQATIGSATIPRASTNITIKTKAVTSNSKIFTSPRSATGGLALIIGKIKEGESFSVTVEHSFNKDIEFDWWIIN